MPQLIIALIIVFGGLWGIRKAARMQPQQARDFGKKAGGMALIAVAAVMALRGSFNTALAILGIGLGLLGAGWVRNFQSPFGVKEKATGQKSQVATSWLMMELDHDSGEMRGEILKGRYRGRALATLTRQELQSFYQSCAKAGDQSLQLLEAWLTRYQPDWRTFWQAQAEQAHAQTSSSSLSEAEALAILGLKPGASRADIKAAHRRLMKDYHPDHGGSDYLATQINRAKDVLLQD